MRSFITSISIATFLLAAGAGLAEAQPPLQAAPQATMYLTPTPNSQGQVLYTVQTGDTLWTISAITGVPIDQLEQLNNIRREDTLTVGTQLVLAVVAQPTSEATYAFEPSATPSPLPVSGKGTICVSFFNDANGDAVQQEDTEGLVAGGQVSVALTDGTEIGTYTTDGVNEPYCFKDIPAGDYNIAAAAPEKYNPTSEMNKHLTLEPGDTAYVSFSVQSGSTSGGGGGSTGGGGGSPLLAIAGIALLGGAGAMLYFVTRPKGRARY